MKKYILFFISAFLVSALIVGGVVWGFAKTEKNQTNTAVISKTKIIDVEELVRLLIPNEGQKMERWDIYTNLADYVEWDSLSLKYNTWKGICTLSWGGEIPMMLGKKLVPREWAVYLLGDGPEYNGFFIKASPNMPQCVYPDFEFRDPFTLKQGDYIDNNYGDNKKDYCNKDVIANSAVKYQFKGKIPAWIYVDFSTRISCYFNPEKRRAVAEEIFDNLYLKNY